MKTTTILLTAAAVLALGGCESINHVGLHTKSVSISASKPGSSTTRVSSNAGGPRHCPPGHAKKGEC